MRGGKVLRTNMCSRTLGRLQRSAVVMGGEQSLKGNACGVGPGKAAGFGVPEGETQPDNPYP